MSLWFKRLLTIILVCQASTSFAVLGDHCTWPTSSDTFSERSTGYVVTSTDWNKAQCALNKLQTNLGTNLANVLKLSANNTISGNSIFTGDVTFSDFASCNLSVDSNGKLGCSGSSLTCNTIMGCEAKNTDAQYLSVTGGPCNPSTGTCLFEISPNWVDLSNTSLQINTCRLGTTPQARLELLCKLSNGQEVRKKFAWTTESGSGGGSGCGVGQALVGGSCLPVTDFQVEGTSKAKVNLVSSAITQILFDDNTKQLTIGLNQGAVAPINLYALNNNTGSTGECVKLGTDPIGEFDFEDCYTPTATKTECLTMLASAITCKNSGGCTDPADIDGTNFSYRGAAFSDSTDQTGNFVFKTPSNLAGTTASVKFGWISNNAACDNGSTRDVCWQIDGDSFANDAAFNSGSLGATDVAVTDRCIANGDLMISAPVTFTHSMLPDETAVISITRDTDESSTECAAGDDDYAASATLLWVEFCYEVDNVFSGE